MGAKQCAQRLPTGQRIALQLGHGDQSAREELIPLVYVELRRIARRYLWKERPNHTLQSGALVHEAYLHLLHEEPPQWQNEPTFLALPRN